jgi:DNA-binding transcriptional regulator YiaG
MYPISGDEIRTLRDTLGLTQWQLATELGCHPNYIGRWERGEVTPNSVTRKLLADMRDQLKEEGRWPG